MDQSSNELQLLNQGYQFIAKHDRLMVRPIKAAAA
jgi:hypothetical protein